MIPVSVLFARSDSIYKELSFDVWDQERDARGYAGPWSVVAHPPCRAWGRLRHRAKPRHDEAALAVRAVELVRLYGGVLEHPFGSALWPVAGLPARGSVDTFGGRTLLVRQEWWGHAAPKPTLLYVVGLCYLDLARLLPRPGALLHRAGGNVTRLTRSEREATPENFARWLVQIAALCVKPAQGGA